MAETVFSVSPNFKGNGDAVRCSCVSSDNRWFVCGGFSNFSAQICTIQTGECIRILRGHNGQVFCCSISSDDKWIVTGSEDGTLRIWDVISTDRVYVLNGHTDWVTCCAISSDNKWIVSGSHDKTIRIWDVKHGKCIHVLQGHEFGITCCSMSGDNKWIVSGSNDTTVRIWDIENGKCRVLSGHKQPVSCCSISLDNSWIVSGGGMSFGDKDMTLQIWDINTASEIYTLYGHGHSITACFISPNGKWLVSASKDSTLRMWDSETGKCIRTLQGHTDTVTCCSISSDSKWVVSGSADRKLLVWDSETGACVRTLNGHSKQIICCTISSDDKWIISGGLDGWCIWSNEWSISAVPVALPPNNSMTEYVNPIRLFADETPSNNNNNTLPSWIPILSTGIQKGETIGQGSYGIVYKGTWQNRTVAIKEFLLHQMTDKTMENFKREASIMSRLDSPHIVKFYGAVLEIGAYALVMDFLPNKSLYHLLHSNADIKMAMKAQIIHDIIQGLKYLHDHKITHRDLKSGNVLLDDIYHAQLCDFGLSKVKEETSITSHHRVVGTTAWLAPETLDPDGEFTFKSDMYSFGMTLWEIVSRDIPFRNAKGDVSSILMWINQGKYPKIPADTPLTLATIITACWSVQPERRPDATAILDDIQKWMMTLDPPIA